MVDSWGWGELDFQGFRAASPSCSKNPLYILYYVSPCSGYVDHYLFLCVSCFLFLSVWETNLHTGHWTLDTGHWTLDTPKSKKNGRWIKRIFSLGTAAPLLRSFCNSFCHWILLSKKFNPCWKALSHRVAHKSWRLVHIFPSTFQSFTAWENQNGSWKSKIGKLQGRELLSRNRKLTYKSLEGHRHRYLVII